MDGKEAIIKRIKTDAEKKAREIIDSAEKNAEERKADAENWAKDYIASQEKILKRDAEEVLSRRLTVADLDVRKIILNAKQQVIAGVLNAVFESLCSLNKGDYLKLVAKLIEENAEIGDEVVLSSDGVLTADNIKSLKIYAEKKLSVSKAAGDFKGGVYLIGKTCDKSLTFYSLINEDREALITKAAEMLFGK